MQRLKVTPFHSRTSALMQGAEWRRWGGYQVASCYEMVPDREYYSVRSSTAMFDVSPLAKYRIKGLEARPFLQKLLTRNIQSLVPGKVIYSPWCDSRGKVVDDGTLACFAEDDFQLTAAEQGEAWLKRVATGFQVTIDNISDDYGILALQGPTSRGLLNELVGEGIDQLGFSEAASFEVEDVPVWISRTGYTGDLGYEVWVKAQHAEKLWDRLVEIGFSFALMPAGIWALDVARVEAGLIMLDVDYLSALRTESLAQTSSPFELGLGWSVHFKKGDFVGREALWREKEENSTPYRFVTLVMDDLAYREAFQQVGLAVDLPVQAWRGMHPLFDAQGEQPGYATCGTWSPTTQKYIMLAQVEPAYSAEGSELLFDAVVDRKRRKFPCRVVKTPVFETSRKKECYAKV
ncbi:MAG: aminomethyltransferase family protein [Vulcanimicrobiota bacterium]